MASRAGRRVHRRPRKFLEGLAEQLIAYAEHEFRLERKEADGATERQHRESAARQFAKLGVKPKHEVLPEPPPFPDELDYLWGWFGEISGGLAANGFGPPMVTWPDLGWWCSLTGDVLEPWEARLLVRLGVVRAVAASEKAQKATPEAPPPKRRR